MTSAPGSFPWWPSRVVVPRASPSQGSQSTLWTSRSLAETRLPRLERFREIWCQVWVKSCHEAMAQLLGNPGPSAPLPAAETAAALHQQHPTHDLNEPRKENLHSIVYGRHQTAPLKRSELYKDCSKGPGCSLCSPFNLGRRRRNTKPRNICCRGEHRQLG